MQQNTGLCKGKKTDRELAVFFISFLPFLHWFSPSTINYHYVIISHPRESATKTVLNFADLNSINAQNAKKGKMQR